MSEFAIPAKKMKNVPKWFRPNFDVTTGNDHTAGVPVKNTSKSKDVKKLLTSLKLSCNSNILSKVAPKCVGDLAVHSKKVIEVENWLKHHVMSKNAKVSAVLLTGPTGAGKTATVCVLCSTLNIQLVEWINPVEIDMEEFRGPGQTARFTEFLIQSSRYPSLIGNKKHKVILVEDFPNSIVHNPSDLDGILELLYRTGIASVIFICTDDKDNSSNMSQQLFPDLLKIKYKMSTISFNPASVTLLKAALKRACNIIESQLGDEYQIPGTGTLDSIVNTATGDVRSAVNYLQFACLKGSASLPTTIQHTPSTGAKRKRKEKDKGTLSLMARDQSLGLLHGVGRVLYPKRIPTPHGWTFEHAAEDIVNQFLTIPSVFVSFLHENYLRYYGDFTGVQAAAEVLSDAEMLMAEWQDRAEIHLYGLWISIQGLMVHNKHAVPKWNPVQGPKHFKYKKIEQKYDNMPIDPVDVGFYNTIKPEGYVTTTADRFKRA
ncbi:Rad17 [Carabus blaptoides fortunei]